MGRLPILRDRTTASKIAVATALVVAAFWAPSGAEAQPQQEIGEGGEMESSAAIIELDVDVARADTATLNMTLEELAANVQAQLTDLRNARAAVTSADAEVVAADQAVAATQVEIDHWVAESDRIVVDAFITPPMLGAADMIESDTIADATMKHAVLELESDNAADSLANLEESRSRLVEQREAQEVAVGEAESRRDDAEAALENLEAAASQQANFISLVEQRLDQELSEAAGIAAIDPAMAASLDARQAELLAKLQEIADSEAYAAAMEALAAAEAAADEPPPPVLLGPPSGNLASVPCPAGLGSITVDAGELAGQLASLLGAAEADGVNLCGDGYRSTAAQIEARRNNCGTSNYAIYEMPASQCNPPTARPGYSMHEQGLAIDFTCNGGGVIPSRSSACYQWLDANAAGYGLYNLPSEAWHWSTNGN